MTNQHQRTHYGSGGKPADLSTDELMNTETFNSLKHRDSLLTVDQLAERLQVPKSWIYERTRQGQEAIPHIKLGLYVRFDLNEVMKFFKMPRP